jgi:LPXTG-site transpeptidase (sortase) family protein
MYRRRNASGASRLLGGAVIIVLAVVAFGAYQILQQAPAQEVIVPVTATTIPPTQVATSVAQATAQQNQLRIVSPKASLSTAITELYFSPDGENWDLTYLENFAGHLEGTPELGKGGNFVLAGHVELKDGIPGPFVNLYKLVPGDDIMIYSEVTNQPYVVRYRVTEVKTVQPNDISVIRNRGYEELTLITCSDWDQETEQYLTRVIVHAKPY